ncbi:DUF1168 domain containing protein [Trichuris trichiura]|uniref:DUF1168 domain containing protein n=1 Tax=Trichuris trichiura TaxID=36087 RepID=A0A077ZHX2_TRITR|nr:DUF1168 domain containing protein [Trichuris trichiura]
MLYLTSTVTLIVKFVIPAIGTMSCSNRFRRRNDDDDDEDYLRGAKTASDVQRLRLEKLLENIDKPVKIPEVQPEWKPEPPPEFVRNVVGSSAGAGSGEYHIYRNIRKKESERLQYIEQQALKVGVIDGERSMDRFFVAEETFEGIRRKDRSAKAISRRKNVKEAC